MTAANALRVDWRPRATPLAPVAVAATGEPARALARRILLLADEALAALRGVAGPAVIVVGGDALPWVDGVSYLGRDPAAPSLLLPTAREPSVPLPLFERAVLARAPAFGTPLVVLDAPALLAPFGAARPVARATLAAWLADKAGRA